MFDFLSYLWWRIAHRGPGLPVDEAIPYAVTGSPIRPGGLVYLIPDWEA